MKTLLLTLATLLLTALAGRAQPAPSRVSFRLKNNLGYTHSFLITTPGQAPYTLLLKGHETRPLSWPVGTSLSFGQTGRDTAEQILTVSAADEGQTLYTDPTAHQATAPRPDNVRLRLRNNSWRPRKVALISYAPGQNGNSTNIVWLAPKAVTVQYLPEGARLYLASNEQVEVVMSGRRIDSDKPFLVVSRTDGNKTFNMFE